MPRGSEEAYGKKGKKSHGMTDDQVRQGFSKTPIPAKDRPGMHHGPGTKDPGRSK